MIPITSGIMIIIDPDTDAFAAKPTSKDHSPLLQYIPHDRRRDREFRTAVGLKIASDVRGQIPPLARVAATIAPEYKLRFSIFAFN